MNGCLAHPNLLNSFRYELKPHLQSLLTAAAMSDGVAAESWTPARTIAWGPIMFFERALRASCNACYHHGYSNAQFTVSHQARDGLVWKGGQTAPAW